MPQPLSNYDDRDDHVGLIGEERAEEYPPRDRRLPMIVLSIVAMAVFAGGLWFAYVQGTKHAVGTTVQSDGVPLIHADTSPTKVKPDKPGGMAIPDQNVSLYNEKPGVAPVERLLPPAEQPLPRPAAPPREAAVSPLPSATKPPAESVPPAVPKAAAKPAPAKPVEKAAAPRKGTTAAAAAPQKATAAAAPAAIAGGRIQVRLASLRTPEEARTEWARLKHENADLLGSLTAVAVRTDLGDKGIYYRIEAGPFANMTAAERLCGEMKRRNLGCILAR